MASEGWIRCEDELPPDGELVMTKIHDGMGCRNEAKLSRSGRLWFSGNMYVYYEPTHWHRLETQTD